MLTNKIEILPKMIMIWSSENMAHFRLFKNPSKFFGQFFSSNVFAHMFFLF